MSGECERGPHYGMHSPLCLTDTIPHVPEASLQVTILACPWSELPRATSEGLNKTQWSWALGFIISPLFLSLWNVGEEVAQLMKKWATCFGGITVSYSCLDTQLSRWLKEWLTEDFTPQGSPGFVLCPSCKSEPKAIRQLNRSLPGYNDCNVKPQ